MDTCTLLTSTATGWLGMSLTRTNAVVNVDKARSKAAS
jgi:hypothetical protein